MEPSKAQSIKALLRDWDSLDRKEKNTMSGGNADYWHRTYILNASDDSLVTLGSGANKRVVTTDKLFDELLSARTVRSAWCRKRERSHARGGSLSSRTG
jgi:hypothetical protein